MDLVPTDGVGSVTASNVVNPIIQLIYFKIEGLRVFSALFLFN
jgi:hypothetical protein